MQSGLPESISQWLEQITQSTVSEMIPVAGGCINQAARLTLSDGKSLFIKYNQECANDFFTAEAGGLQAIHQQVDSLTPTVIACSEKALLLEYLQPVSPGKNDWRELGESLAKLHQQSFKQFGFNKNNYCGLTPQVNTMMENGYQFFAKNRLNCQAKMAYDKGHISVTVTDSIKQLASRLSRWIPPMPAVLIHGDLWSGNVMATDKGARLVDPACYYGWAEAELAMTWLFGGFDTAFYQAYEYHGELEKDWRERVPLYNLYHLLNHANLFGGSYVSQVKDSIRQFV